MSETLLRSFADYKATSEWIRSSVEGLTDEQLSWKPSPDKWSVKEVVAHLVDSSLVHSVRIRKIVAEPNPSFVLYDQDAWVSTAKSNEESIDRLLSALDSILAYNVLYYGRLSEADWNRIGLNEGKEVPLYELFESFVRHSRTHLAQIERTKAARIAAEG
ncbi:DinB family protein [Cohnella faecalis]|uniref:DUF664 domain-containing protein n=1 Tax=Cohnella faecalis TaxID=2315694 RepID=A0A398CP52_9BACL|nr:DinB family protein [Cohnella faecalis]RIE05166.1 DUF664 domain-containing protein [Cohnella faecalis]